MTTYAKNILTDGFEYYWMKTILAREDEQVTLVDRLLMVYFIINNEWNSAGSQYGFRSFTRKQAEARLKVWFAYWKGDRSALRQEVETIETGRPIVEALIKSEVHNPMMWVRLAIYAVVAVGVMALFWVLLGH